MANKKWTDGPTGSERNQGHKKVGNPAWKIERTEDRYKNYGKILYQTNIPCFPLSLSLSPCWSHFLFPLNYLPFCSYYISPCFRAYAIPPPFFLSFNHTRSLDAPFVIYRTSPRPFAKVLSILTLFATFEYRSGEILDCVKEEDPTGDIS